ncbi:MAG: universal stress protein [Deltaproteobacteria bacterium]|nr:universal stress protein [Deltaproteobacteria bacterium]
MTKYAKILVPLDGSELAEAAITAALPLAKTFGAPVVLLGVLDLTAGMYDVYSEAFNPIDLKSQLESFLDAALARAQARVEAEGVECRRVLKVGVPHEEIATVVAEEAADLVVMTTHGRRGLSHLLLGSVTEKLIRTAPCQVLVVPAGEER